MIGILGLLSDVFVVAAAEAGVSFEPPRKGTSTTCPFCRANELSFSVRDSIERWKCFRASCDRKGGALDVPILFGLATDEKSAAKWLVEHGFLHRRERTMGKPFSIGRVERAQVDTSTLSPERAALRAESATAACRDGAGRGAAAGAQLHRRSSDGPRTRTFA